MRKDRSIRSIIIVVFIGWLAIGIIDVTLVNFAETSCSREVRRPGSWQQRSVWEEFSDCWPSPSRSTAPNWPATW
jgi:hypothetical protein